jgi:transposase
MVKTVQSIMNIYNKYKIKKLIRYYQLHIILHNRIVILIYLEAISYLFNSDITSFLLHITLTNISVIKLKSIKK